MHVAYIYRTNVLVLTDDAAGRLNLVLGALAGLLFVTEGSPFPPLDLFLRQSFLSIQRPTGVSTAAPVSRSASSLLKPVLFLLSIIRMIQGPLCTA